MVKLINLGHICRKSPPKTIEVSQIFFSEKTPLHDQTVTSAGGRDSHTPVYRLRYSSLARKSYWVCRLLFQPWTHTFSSGNHCPNRRPWLIESGVYRSGTKACTLPYLSRNRVRIPWSRECFDVRWSKLRNSSGLRSNMLGFSMNLSGIVLLFSIYLETCILPKTCCSAFLVWLLQ